MLKGVAMQIFESSGYGVGRRLPFQLRVSQEERAALAAMSQALGVSKADLTRRGWRLVMQDLRQEGVQIQASEGHDT